MRHLWSKIAPGVSLGRPWCRHCKAVTPVFKRMEREFAGADFFKLNFKAETAVVYSLTASPPPLPLSELL